MLTPWKLICLTICLACGHSLTAQSVAGEIANVAFDAQHKKLYLHTNKGLYTAPMAAPAQTQLLLYQQGNPVHFHAFPNQTLATIHKDGWVLHWQDREITNRIELLDDKGDRLKRCDKSTFDNFNLYLAVSDQRGDIHLYNSRNGRYLRTLPGGAGDVTELTFDATGKYLAARWDKGVVKVWRVVDGSLWNKWSVLEGESRALRFHPFREILAFANGAQVDFVSLEDGSEWSISEGIGDYIMDMVFHPQRGQLALATVRGTVKLIHPHTGQLLATLDHGEQELHDLIYSPTGDLLISADKERLRFWRPGNGQEVESLSWEGRAGK